MDGHIGHLHCRYRYLGHKDDSVSAAMRLDRLAREELPAAYEEALEGALGDDHTVYVLRRVDSNVLINLGQNAGDRALARRWGRRLAGSVVQAIARDESENLVRFADQAEYVASFVGDLLRQRAWDRWYYGAFAHLKPLNTVQALHRVLLDQGERLPAVLAALHRKRTLEQVTVLLTGPLLEEVCTQRLGEVRPPDEAELRPLFEAAFRLVEQLGLWVGTSPAANTLFRTYIESGRLPSVDWRDTVSLAAAVFDALRFLSGKGNLQRLNGAPDHAFIARLRQALNELDWLDHAWLQEAVLDLVAGAESQKEDLPVRRPQSKPTPRQRELLEELAAILLEDAIALDRERPDSPANLLRWYGALVARAPRWSGDRLAVETIRRLLQAWARWPESDTPTMPVVRSPGDEGEILMTAPRNREGAPNNREIIFGLGEPGLRVLEQLTGEDTSASGSVIETGCAGLFLLLRAILDLRLPQLVEAAEYPAGVAEDRLGLLLTSVCLRWAGEAAFKSGQIDPGLCLLAGRESPSTLADLQAAWSGTSAADHARFREGLLRTLAGQRILAEESLHLFRLDDGTSSSTLVSGDATGRLWPLGGRIATERAATAVLNRWLDAWEQATGVSPTIVCTADIGEALSGKVAADLVILDGSAPKELLEAHQAGKEALRKAMQAMDAGRLGPTDVDLAMFLTASVLLRVWARWLRQFADSSLPYLLENFIRRPGLVHIERDRLEVFVEQGPMDLVVEMAGYTAELTPVAWLGRRSIRYRLGS